jgi:plastocyanin
MTRIAILLAACVTALALALPVSAMSVPKLVGTVGPGFTITLTKGGKKVTKLKAGKYTLTVHDKSNIHDFHISGPGLNKVVTTTPQVKTKTMTIKLKKGTYKYVCDPHSSTMKGSFKVT